jgi:hypothetical protein
MKFCVYKQDFVQNKFLEHPPPLQTGASGDKLWPSFKSLLEKFDYNYQKIIHSSANPGGYPFFPK